MIDMFDLIEIDGEDLSLPPQSMGRIATIRFFDWCCVDGDCKTPMEVYSHRAMDSTHGWYGYWHCLESSGFTHVRFFAGLMQRAKTYGWDAQEKLVKESKLVSGELYPVKDFFYLIISSFSDYDKDKAVKQIEKWEDDLPYFKMSQLKK